MASWPRQHLALRQPHEAAATTDPEVLDHLVFLDAVGHLHDVPGRAQENPRPNQDIRFPDLASEQREASRLIAGGSFLDLAEVDVSETWKVAQELKLDKLIKAKTVSRNSSEISAVCTHPDHRGKGYGGALLAAVGARMLSEGITPFLHAYASNTGAIALYRRMGFAHRCNVVHQIWERAPGSEVR